MAEAVIFVGLQGSGKTTYFTKHFAATHKHISRDISGSADREAILIQECLRLQRSFVLDNTNAARAVRQPTIRQAKAAGFRVLCYFFDVPLRTAIGRNNHRKDKKPVPVLSNPFPNGIIQPPQRNADPNLALYGQGITTQVSNNPLGYTQQWNFDI